MCSIWERWEGEEEAAYGSFRYYLEQTHPRRINSLYLVQTIALPTLLSWAQRYQWVRRAEAFDAHFRSIRDEHLEALMKEHAESIAQKHAETLADIREIVGIELAKNLARVKSSPGTLMTFSEVIKACDMVIKADRLIRDMSTDKVQIDLTNASIEDLQRLRDETLRLASEGDTENE